MTRVVVLFAQADLLNQISGNPGLAGLDTDQAKQTTPLLTYTENRVTNAIASPDTRPIAAP